MLLLDLPARILEKVLYRSTTHIPYVTHFAGLAKSSMVLPKRMPVVSEITPDPKGVLICRQTAQVAHVLHNSHRRPCVQDLLG